MLVNQKLLDLNLRSLRSRRKRGRGRGARTREKNGGLAPRPPFFSRIRVAFPLPHLRLLCRLELSWYVNATFL